MNVEKGRIGPLSQDISAPSTWIPTVPILICLLWVPKLLESAKLNCWRPPLKTLDKEQVSLCNEYFYTLPCLRGETGTFRKLKNFPQHCRLQTVDFFAVIFSLKSKSTKPVQQRPSWRTPPPSRTRSAAAECLPLTPRRGSGVGVPCDDVLIESTLSRQSCAHLVPPPFSHPLSCLPLLLLCSPVLSSCSSPRASYSFWSDHSKQFFFFPGTLLLSVWRSSFRSQHGPQQQHLQIPPPGAPRPHGGLCTHR